MKIKKIKDYTKPEEVEACKRWLKYVQAKPTKTIRRHRGSGYGFKHDVEDWTRSNGNSEQGMYISEDSFNQAMRDSKFRLEPITSWRQLIDKVEPRSFFFNISLNSKRINY